MRALDDAGSVTIEAALSLASLVIVAAGIVGGIATLSAHLAAIDAAGAAARAHVAQNHAIEGEARAIVAVYRKLLA